VPKKEHKMQSTKPVELTHQKVSINFRVSRELREDLKEEAWRNRQSLNEYLLEIVEKRATPIQHLKQG
jgi:predicted HicB family RNase H-like nuclease